MPLCKHLGLVFACLWWCSVAISQEHSSPAAPGAAASTESNEGDFRQTAVPITEWKLTGPQIEGLFGTGFCLDPACGFIVTNYHVAALAHPHKLRGIRIEARYLGTGPTDEGATLNNISSARTLKYTPGRDLAIFRLSRPLPEHHGVGFDLNALEPGEEVVIYAYPLEGISPLRKLLGFPGCFEGQTMDGLLAFQYSPSKNKSIRPGASGGIVVNPKNGRIVGVLNAVGIDRKSTALAVPVQALADFVFDVDPTMAATLFPAIGGTAQDSADIYSEYRPISNNTLEKRPLEPEEVLQLRLNAQLLADGMRNYIAVQSFAWGSGSKPPKTRAEYEIRVIDGRQKFRKYPDGKKEYAEASYPQLDGWVAPADEWSRLPTMVGTELRLKVRRAADTFVKGERRRIFQYYASPEDGVCQFRAIEDFGFFNYGKTVGVGCYGEVWTDENENIVRMSENLDLSQNVKSYRGWRGYRVVMTYGWLQRVGEPASRIPQTIYTEARHKKELDWCRGRFTQYRVFSAQAAMKIAAN